MPPICQFTLGHGMAAIIRESIPVTRTTGSDQYGPVEFYERPRTTMHMDKSNASVFRPPTEVLADDKALEDAAAKFIEQYPVS